MDIKDRAKTQAEKISKQLTSAGWNVLDIAQKQYNFEITAEKGGFKLKGLIYFGKKGLKMVVQGNNGSPVYSEFASFFMETTDLFGPKTVKIEEPDAYIGSDEAGKGDFFGPLVTAAVYTDENLREELRAAGVRDSKELNDPRINAIAAEIKPLLEGKYNIVFLKPEKYNELYPKFGNLNKMLDWCHSAAISGLLEKQPCAEVIVDQFSKKQITAASKSFGFPVRFQQTPKAEQFTGVAAASILARNAFNFWFEDRRREGYELPKGASSLVDKAGVKIFHQFGDDTLTKLAKVHFKNYLKIQTGIL